MKDVQSGGTTAAGPRDWFTGAVSIDGVQSPGESNPSATTTTRREAGNVART